MNEFITIDLSQGTAPSYYDRTAGVSGESYVKGLEFILPAEFDDWSVFVDVLNPCGEKYRQELLAISPTSHTIRYEFSQVDLKHKGKLYVDLVLVKNFETQVGDTTSVTSHVAKPFRGEFAVKEAVCAYAGPPSGLPPILTAEVTQMITDLMAIYEAHDFTLLDKIAEENDRFVFDGEPYVTKGDLDEAVATAVSAEVQGERLILTYGEGRA